MRANKYGNFLTIILIILIVGILIGGGILIYSYVIKPRVKEEETAKALAEFDRNIQANKETIEQIEQQEQQTEQNVDTDTKPQQPQQYQTTTTPQKKKTYYNGFVMIGTINIPKTNLKEAILDEATPKAIDTAVAVLYPTNAELNEPGNVVIIGHNYRNGKFFSNNKKLSVGDKIQIKDETGRQLSYTIYQKFETTPEDASFYNRDTNGVPEITLSTCTDDAKARIIILARADQ